MIRMTIYYATVAVAILLLSASTSAFAGSEYQFGVDLLNAANDPTLAAKTSAFLWVPPHADHLRAIILAPANIIEREFCDDSIVRAMAEKEDVAILFFQAGWTKLMPDSGMPGYVQNVLNHLADQSGIAELRTVPWIPIGHSGNSQFVARLGRSAPDRVLCTVVIKGALQQPEKGSIAGLTDMPMLVIHGEFEEISNKVIRNQWWDDFVSHFNTLRAVAPHALASGLLDRDYGHIWWSPELSKYTASFIRDSLAARLPGGNAPVEKAPVEKTPGDVTTASALPQLRKVTWESGWLVDPAEAHPAAPVASYTGDPVKAFWVFDEAMANDWKTFFERDKDKKSQLLAFDQDGQICPWWHGWGVQDYKFEPEPDGDSFKVHAVFRDKVPETYPDANLPLGHGDPAGIYYKVVGWAGQTQQISPDRFGVRFDREGVNGRTVHILIGAIHPGDANYRAAMTACSLDVPSSNAGAAQTITFPKIDDVPASNKAMELKATVDSPLPVRYYISWGPAEIDGNTLRLSDIPYRAKFPIEVKLTAYQWGKAGAFATAKPVTQVFHVVK